MLILFRIIILHQLDFYNYRAVYTMKREGQDPFDTFISQLGQQSFYKKAISHQCKFFQITVHQLHKLNPKEVKLLRLFIQTKREEDEFIRKKMEQEWLQHEKRLFTWLFICFLEMHNKTVADLSEVDYKFLSDISTQKSIPLVKYLVHSLSKQEKRPVWSKQQDLLLQKILAKEKKFMTVGQWSNVSRQLFLRGSHMSYKSGKNCRERWYNHINPQLNKEWNPEEDLKLFQFVSKEGKKWARVIPLLNNTKSEHMIKNRFNSCIKKMQSQFKNKSKESDLIKLFIEKLTTEKLKNSSQCQARSKEQHLRKTNHPELLKQQPFNIMQSQIIKTTEDNLGLNEEQIKFLEENKLIKEDNHQGNKNDGDLKLFQSMRFNITSPLPLTPFQFCITPKTEQNFKSSFLNMAGFINRPEN